MRALAVVAVLGGVAHADTPVMRPEATELDRETPPPGRAEFGFDGGAPVGAWAAAVQLGYLDRPLVLHAGSLEVVPVEHRETLALGGAVSLGATGVLVLDARMPFAHQVGERLVALGDPRALDRFVLGDLAIGARVRIAAGERLQTFARVVVTLPTGDDDSFAGEARWTGSGLLIARATLPAHVTLAATGGILLRGAEVQVADRVVGDALVGGIGAAVGLPPALGLWCVPDQLRVTAELVGSLGDKASASLGPSPAEARLAVIGRPLRSLAIGIRAGIGLDDQIGSPRWRATLELTYQAPQPPPPPPPQQPAEPEDEDERD
jgi:hypothetical protein